MRQSLSFLSNLARHNDREWFNANKKDYLEIKNKIENLTGYLINLMSDFEPSVSGLKPADCLYRIYRDTRFSLDKTPYKQHIGIYINPNGGKKSALSGYYLHIEPGKSFLGGGLWCPSGAVLKAVRQSIYDNVEEYLEIIQNPEFHELFPLIGDDFLKTAPKGFPKDWEHIDLLRPRSFTVGNNVSDSFITAGSMPEQVASRFEVMKKFNDFINYVFEENPDLPRYL